MVVVEGEVEVVTELEVKLNGAVLAIGWKKSSHVRT